MIINISDIIIPHLFTQSPPREDKINRCREYYNKHQHLDREIIVNSDNVLVDGYIGYLVLTENNIQSVGVIVCSEAKEKTREPHPCYYRGYRTIYVYGKSIDDDLESVWRIVNPKISVDDVKVGTYAVVERRHGERTILITDVKESKWPPIKGRVKRVIKLL